MLFREICIGDPPRILDFPIEAIGYKLLNLFI